MSATATIPTATVPSITEIHHWISGAPVTGKSNRFADVFHPATGRIQSRVPLASEAEVNAAVAAAAAAFPDWAAQQPLRRARVLFRFREIFERRLDEVATLINREHGKVFSDARGEATRGLEVVEFGNGTSLFTRDGDTARDFTRRVQAGMVGINVPIPSRWPSTASAAGSAPSLETTPSTAPKAFTSTPASRPSPAAGPPASAPE